MSPPRRGRSPPLVVPPLLFLLALFLLCPTDACEETITQFHLAVGGGGGGGKKRERGDRKEKKKEPMQIKTKKSLPSSPSPSSPLSPPLLSLREEEETTKTSVSLEGGEGERGKKRRGEFVGWRNWVMGAGRGKGGKAQKLGGGRGQKTTKKVFLFFLLRHFRHSHFVIQSASGGRGKRERKKAFHSSPCQVLSPLSWISFFSLDENGANSFKTSSFPNILTYHYLPLLSCNFLNFRQDNVVRNLN